MSKTVFISRDLSEAPEFVRRLRTAGWAVQGQSLVELTPLPFDKIPEADWIFFASKNAVRFFYSNVSPEKRSTRYRIAAIGPSTAAELLKYLSKVDFTGTGDPEETAENFIQLSTGQKVLFPAARNSRRSVPELLGDKILAIHLEVYDNRPIPDPPKTDACVLVFTSPMNAATYFERHTLETDQKVVAIGNTTAAALAELGLKAIRVAAEPSEAALANEVLAIRM